MKRWMSLWMVLQSFGPLMLCKRSVWCTWYEAFLPFYLHTHIIDNKININTGIKWEITTSTCRQLVTWAGSAEPWIISGATGSSCLVRSVGCVDTRKCQIVRHPCNEEARQEWPCGLSGISVGKKHPLFHTCTHTMLSQRFRVILKIHVVTCRLEHIEQRNYLVSVFENLHFYQFRRNSIDIIYPTVG